MKVVDWDMTGPPSGERSQPSEKTFASEWSLVFGRGRDYALFSLDTLLSQYTMGANSGLMRGLRPMAKRAGQQAKQARVGVQAARTLVTATTSTVQTPSATRSAATPAPAGE